MKRELVYARRRLQRSRKLPGAMAPLSGKRYHIVRILPHRDFNSWLVLTALILGFSLSMLDTSIVNISLPTIQNQLHTDLATVSWVLHAYNLMLAVSVIIAGRFADQYGRKRLFMFGLIIFGSASFLCATASNVEWLIGFRAVQGTDASILNTASLATSSSIRCTGFARAWWGAHRRYLGDHARWKARLAPLSVGGWHRYLCHR